MSAKSASSARRRRDKESGGRPSKLDAKTAELIAAAVRNLAPWRDAFRIAGIAEATGHKWRKDGESDRKLGRNTPERRFLESLEKAEAEGKALLAGRIMRATAWDPHLALKVLAVRDPQNWGTKATVDVRDITPPPSPRSRLMQRLDAIEDRLIQAEREGVARDLAREVESAPPPEETRS